MPVYIGKVQDLTQLTPEFWTRVLQEVTGLLYLTLWE